MILDANGKPTGNIPHTFMEMPEKSTAQPEPKRHRDYVPAPGRVTVLRDKVERKMRHGELELEKPEFYAKAEEFFSIFATVAAVGDRLPGGVEPWFERGDKVTILPSLFDQIELSPTLTVWVGPFGAVTGKFVETDDTASE